MAYYQVTFPNGSSVISKTASIMKEFVEPKVKLDKLPKDFSMTEDELRLHNASFSSLVAMLDAKYSHTYEDTTTIEEEEPYDPGFQAMMDRLSSDEAFNWEGTHK